MYSKARLVQWSTTSISTDNKSPVVLSRSVKKNPRDWHFLSDKTNQKLWKSLHAFITLPHQSINCKDATLTRRVKIVNIKFHSVGILWVKQILEYWIWLPLCLIKLSVSYQCSWISFMDTPDTYSHLSRVQGGKRNGFDQLRLNEWQLRVVIATQLRNCAFENKYGSTARSFSKQDRLQNTQNWQDFSGGPNGPPIFEFGGPKCETGGFLTTDHR